MPTAANVGYYAKIVAQKAVLRRLIQTATKIVTDGYSEDAPVDELLDQAEQSIMNVNESRNRAGFKAIKDVLNSTFEEIDRLSQKGDTVTGLSTGYPDLDKMTTGLHDDELMILAARPAVGKTAFALNIAQNVGTKTDKAVAIFSLEMSAESLVNRMLCAEGSINANHLRTGQLEEGEWQNLIVAMGSLSKAKIFIDDTAGIKMSEIRAKCRRLSKEQNGNLGLVVVDYLQLVESTGAENRQQEVSAISRQLKKNWQRNCMCQLLRCRNCRVAWNSVKISGQCCQISVNLVQLNKMPILCRFFTGMTTMNVMTTIVMIAAEATTMASKTSAKLKSLLKRTGRALEARLNYCL